MPVSKISLSLTFSYPHQKPLFDGFSWQVQAGQAWAVIGPSGCGKTTLLYLLAGLLHPASGQVCIDGVPFQRPRPQTGLILQDYGLLPWNTVLENARLGLAVRQFYGPDGRHAPPQAVAQGREKRAGEAQAREWLVRLGLAGLEEKYPAQLSGGQRQRVAIARTLALQPDLLLMDEPFSSLDAATREDLRSLTLALRIEQGFTFVVVTHAIEEAVHLGQYILTFRQPPHQVPDILENPCFGLPDPSAHPAYPVLTRALRERLTGSSQIGVR